MKLARICSALVAGAFCADRFHRRSFCATPVPGSPTFPCPWRVCCFARVLAFLLAGAGLAQGD